MSGAQQLGELVRDAGRRFTRRRVIDLKRHTTARCR